MSIQDDETDFFDLSDFEGDNGSTFTLYKWENGKKTFLFKENTVPDIQEVALRFGGGKYTIYIKRPDQKQNTNKTFYINDAISAKNQKQEMSGDGFEKGFRFASEQINNTITNILGIVVPSISQSEKKIQSIYSQAMTEQSKLVKSLSNQMQQQQYLEDDSDEDEDDDDTNENGDDFDPISIIEPYLDSIDDLLGNNPLAKLAIVQLKSSEEFKKILSSNKYINMVFKFLQDTKGIETAQKIAQKLNVKI